MSVINRIEIASLLNKHGDISSPWEAKMRHLMLNLRGQSSAMNMENGFGKTTLSDALIGLLSRDRSLMRKTRKKMSPSRAGRPWTHIRVEFSYSSAPVAQQDILAAAGDSVGGTETWVFGMYGHNDTEPGYYFYQGRMEDLQVSTTTGDHKLQLYSNEHFLHALKQLRPERPRDRESWLDAISLHISRKELEQLATFQKEGGADKSQIFNAIKPRPGEKADQAFFYEVLAPQILAGASQGETDESEEFIEDLVINSGRKVSELRHQMQEKISDLQRSQNKAGRLAELNRAAQKLSDARQARKEILHKLENQANCLVSITRQYLPGIPRLPDDDQPDQQLAQELAIRAGDTEPLIPASVLAKICGTSASRIRDYFESRQLSGYRHDKTAVIYHPQVSWAGAKSMRLYPAARAVDFLNTSQQLFKNDADRINAIELIQDAADNFLDLDSNPFRDSYLADKQYLRTLSDEVRQLKERRRSLEQQREELESRDKEFADNETVYLDALKEGLFNEQELSDIEQTKAQVQQRLTAIEDSYRLFLQTRGQFIKPAEEWHRFVQKHGEHTAPAEYLQSCDQKLESLQKELTGHQQQEARLKAEDNELRQQLGQTGQQLPELNSQLNRLQVLHQSFHEINKSFPDEDIQGLVNRLEQQLRLAREEREQELSNLNQLQSQRQALGAQEASYQQFQKLFPNLTPAGLEDQLRQEKSTLEQHIPQLETSIGSLQVLVSDLLEFRQLASEQEPEDWLRQAQNDYPLLLTQRVGVQTSIEDIKRQLSDLETDPVSPSSTDILCHKLLADNGLSHQPLHKVLDQLLAPEDARRQPWLAQAHNLLFAPVFDSQDSAVQAARLFAVKRLPVPVFTLSTLQVMASGSQNMSLLGAVTGCVSLAVKAMLDPQFIEDWKQQLQANLDQHQQQLGSIDQRLTQCQPDSAAMRSARSAAQAIKEQAEQRLAVQTGELAEHQVRQLQLAEQLTSEKVRLIRQAEVFIEQEGEVELQTLVHSIEQVTDRLEQAQTGIAALEAQLNGDSRRQLDQAEQFLNTGGQEHLAELQEETEILRLKQEQQREQLEHNNAALEQCREHIDKYQARIQSVYQPGERDSLLRLDEYLRAGGREFMAKAEHTQQSLEQQQSLAQRRAAVKFERIRAYLNSKDDHSGSTALKKQIAAIKNSIHSAGQEQEHKEGLIEQLRDSQPRLLQAIHQVDDTADRWLKQLSHFRSMLDDLPEPNPEQLETMPLYEKAWDYCHSCQDESDNIDAIFHQALALSEQLEQENIRELSQELKRKESQHSELENDFREVLIKVQNQDRNLFNATEQARLTTLENADSDALTDLGSMIRALDEQISANEERLNLLQESMSDYEDKLQERLSSIIMHSVDNLRLLRKIASQSHGSSAYFNIQADIVNEEGIRNLVRSLLAEIEENQRQIRSRKAQNLPVGSEEKQVRDLQKNLRNQIYRQLFTNISIRLKHDAIRPHGNLFSLNEDMSEGQREAVSLMWLVKLSEFAIERELRSVPSQYRRKERKSSESVIILDGLFSKLSHKKLIEDSLESLRNTRGRFQMIGLIHNPNYENDPAIFPTYLVGNIIGGLQGQGGHVIVREGVKVNPATVGRGSGEASLFHLHVDTAEA